MPAHIKDWFVIPRMVRVWLFVLLLIPLCAVSALHAETALPDPFSDELDTEAYDCLLVLHPEKTVGAAPATRVMLECGEGENYVRIEIRKSRLRLLTVAGPTQTLVADFASEVTPGTAYALTIHRRATSIALSHGNRLLYRGSAPRGSGREAIAACETGWTLNEARIQRLEPVIFADDFMRAADEKGSWVVESGQWTLQSAWDTLAHGKTLRFASAKSSQNPFAWIGVAGEHQPAVCTTGAAFWEDYTFSVSVQPVGQGAVGVLLNMADANNRVLARWSPANDRRAGGNQLTLYKIIDGKPSMIAKSANGYAPGQWYRLSVVSSAAGVQVLVDGTPRISCPGISRWRGGVGLYVEGTDGAIFDDITVYGQAVDTDLLAEIRQSRIGQRFRDDRAGMQEWALAPDLWQTDPAQPDLLWSPDRLYGSRNRIRTLVTPPANSTGTLTLLLHSERAAKEPSGYRAVITLAEKGQQTVALYRGTALLASTTDAVLQLGEESSLCLTLLGTHVSLEIDGEPVLQADDAQPLESGFAGYRRQGQAFQNLRETVAYSRNLLDYTFAEAPVDWYAIGTWEPSIRWACQPEWSFFSGWSRGDAVLWHKQRFGGDQFLQAYMAVKTEFPREHEVYKYSRHNGFFGVTLCGDGRDPRNGYCGVFGAPGTDGTPYTRAVLLRNGVEVGATPIPAHDWTQTHRAWFVPALVKQGNIVTFTVKVGAERYAVSYTDPKPIDGGVPAVWTHNNAISLARVRMNSASPPTPWKGPQVVIDQPWYPEWANIGQTATYRFPTTFSLQGKRVTLQVTPQTVPPIDATAAVAQGMEVRVTPKAPGEHWYAITATDGANPSQPFHLDQMVFNPAIARDDSHALVLYRFDEGAGSTVHDRSTIGPPLDLTMMGEEQQGHWLPGQGMQFNRASFLLGSADTAEKLLSPAKTRACTIELWLSPETIFGASMPFWWGDNWPNVNLAVWQTAGSLMTSTLGYTARPDVGPGNLYYTSLHHYAITWDGKTTTMYRDGAVIWQAAIEWAVERWGKRKAFVLGQEYAGAIYLFAMHDRCLSPDMITRHYQAGPSAPSAPPGK